jgi:hypothetical protein
MESPIMPDLCDTRYVHATLYYSQAGHGSRAVDAGTVGSNPTQGMDV